VDISEIKSNLREFYNREAETRNAADKKAWKLEVRDDFLSLIKAEGKAALLELGAGAGHDSRFFMDNGLAVTAVDLSPEMVAKCKEKGVEAYELDYYNLSSLGRKFDCIWAMNSLLHVPKADLSGVLDEINSVLNDGGLLYIGVYGGDDWEREDVMHEDLDVPRYYASYSLDSLVCALGNHFMIVSSRQLDPGLDFKKSFGHYAFHSVVVQKNKERSR